MRLVSIVVRGSVSWLIVSVDNAEHFKRTRGVRTMAIVIGIFALIVVGLGIALLVGRLRPVKHEPVPQEHVANPGAQAIPPTASR